MDVSNIEMKLLVLYDALRDYKEPNLPEQIGEYKAKVQQVQKTLRAANDHGFANALSKYSAAALNLLDLVNAAQKVTQSKLNVQMKRYVAAFEKFGKLSDHLGKGSIPTCLWSLYLASLVRVKCNDDVTVAIQLCTDEYLHDALAHFDDTKKAFTIPEISCILAAFCDQRISHVFSTTKDKKPDRRWKILTDRTVDVFQSASELEGR